MLAVKYFMRVIGLALAVQLPGSVMAQSLVTEPPQAAPATIGVSSAVPHLPAWRDVPWTETLDPERRLSAPMSVGGTSSGRIENSVHLPEQGEHHYVLGEHEGRDTHWGGGIIVQAILDAAAWADQRYPGMRVGVGNISVRAGGSLVWSRSHHCGRDADLAFRYLDENGDPVEAQGLHVVRSDLSVREPAGWRVDVPRTWAIVEGLLVTHGGAMQWIFVSQPLKDAMLAHATAISVDPAVIAMASNVLHQPGDSRPHDDHLHLRVFCTALEASEACVDRAPLWEHAELHDELLRARMREFATALTARPDTAEEVFGRIRNSGLLRQIPELFSALPDFSAAVQEQVIELVVLQNDRTWLERLADVAPRMTNESSQRLVVTAMRRLAYNEDAARFLPLLEYRSETGVSLAAIAAEALQRLRHPSVVVGLASLSTSSNPVEAAHAARALCRMTAIGGPDGLCDTSPVLGTAEWHDFWLQQGDLLSALPDDNEVVVRLEEAGFVNGDVRSDAAAWVSLLTHPLDWVRFSAERMLCRAYDETLSAPEDSPEERQEWWSRRIRRRR